MQERPSTPAARRPVGYAIGVASVLACLGLAACTPYHRGPAPTDTAARGPGPVYLGWRLFEDRCARCHGVDARGTNQGPNLLTRIQGMSQQRFTFIVLDRYNWSLPASQTGAEGAARAALVDQMLRREAGEVSMPAWRDEPAVTAHVADLYTYLAARAQGAQGPGRPPR